MAGVIFKDKQELASYSQMFDVSVTKPPPTSELDFGLLRLGQNDDKAERQRKTRIVKYITLSSNCFPWRTATDKHGPR